MLSCNVTSAAARVAASASMLFCRIVSAEARAVASLVIAVVLELINALMSESAFWNASTISVNESNAAGSVLEMMLSTFASMRDSSPVARVTSAARSVVNTPSAAVARAISASSCDCRSESPAIRAAVSVARSAVASAIASALADAMRSVTVLPVEPSTVASPINRSS